LPALRPACTVVMKASQKPSGHKNATGGPVFVHHAIAAWHGPADAGPWQRNCARTSSCKRARLLPCRPSLRAHRNKAACRGGRMQAAAPGTLTGLAWPQRDRHPPPTLAAAFGTARPNQPQAMPGLARMTTGRTTP